MRDAPPPHSIILIYGKPLSSIAYRLQPINKCIVRFYRCLNRNIIGLFEANGLQQFPTNVLHGFGASEVCWVAIVGGVEVSENFGDAECRCCDGSCVLLLFCDAACEVESSADTLFGQVEFGLNSGELLCLQFFVIAKRGAGFTLASSGRLLRAPLIFSA